MTKKRSEFVFLSEQMQDAWVKRVNAAGGHFKLLPLAADVVARPRRAAHHRDDGDVPPPPSFKEVLQKRKG